MAKVLGVGGVFFKSPDPKKLCDWYQKWLGAPIATDFNGVVFTPALVPPGGGTVWSPFEANTDYFAPSNQDFMFNLMVDDIEAALAQVKEGGAKIVGDIMEIPLGRFGWFIDPDGNKVELWAPNPDYHP